MLDQTDHDLTTKKGNVDTRERILDAAEIEFSKNGFDSCSLRSISVNYDINLGLIHYYFRSKKGLFTAIFLRRSELLVGRRNGLLDAALRQSDGEPLAVDEIAICYVIPIIEMLKAGEGPKAYIRIQGLLRTDTSAFARKLRDEAFTATNRRFIRELQRSCPHLPPASVVWRFSAMVGSLYALISQSGRVDALSDGIASSEDVDAALAEVIPFIAGGFAAEPPDRNKPFGPATPET